MVARGVVVTGARADPVILVPTRVASLPAGAASTARAIVDMGALVAPGDGRALRCVGLLAGRCAEAVCNRANLSRTRRKRDRPTEKARRTRLPSRFGARGPRGVAMARDRLEPDVGLDFGLLVSRLTTAFAMLASSFGPPRSSRPAPRDSDA